MLLSGVLAFVLVPFFLFGARVDAWVLDALPAGPKPSIIALLIVALLAADIMLPTPSSFVSTASGALLGFGLGALASWFGMTLGCLIGYWIGASGRAAARALVGSADVRRVEALTHRMGDYALIAFRSVPVLAESSVILAGMGRMDRRRFFMITTLANAGISLAYAMVGAFAAEASSFLLAFAGAIALPSLALGVARSVRGT